MESPTIMIFRALEGEDDSVSVASPMAGDGVWEEILVLVKVLLRESRNRIDNFDD
jgi:hypothetical protein